MEIEYGKKIEFEKELSSLDQFVIAFTRILNKSGIKYVIISGYVAILFGRNRTSEDVDIIIEKLDLAKFKALWTALLSEFECLNTTNAEDAYKIYLLCGDSIRFSRKGKYVPNMEIKFPNISLDGFDLLALNERKEVVVNDNQMFISQIELQIAFKFSLGSDKDIEDAVYLYELFKDKLDIKLLRAFSRKLKIEDLLNKSTE